MSTKKTGKKQPKTKEELLIDAVMEGNVIRVEDLLKSGANPRFEKDKHTPLSLATLRCWLPVARTLVEMGGVSVPEDRRAVHVSAMSNCKNKNMIKYLVDMGGDINRVDEVLGTPLMLALLEGDSEEFARYMVDLGADPGVHCQTGEKSSAIHKACSSCSLEMVKFLLDKGGKKLVNTPDSRGYTPLTCAALSKNRDKDRISIMLIDEYGANPNYMDENVSFTVLFLAVQHGFTSTVEILLERGADVNITDKEMCCTPLHITVSNNHLEIARMLLKHGAKVDCVDKRGYTPLFMAGAEGYFNGVKLLLEHGANVNHKGFDGTTALFHAVSYKQPEIVCILLEYGADKNITITRYPESENSTDEKPTEEKPETITLLDLAAEGNYDPRILHMLQDDFPRSLDQKIKVATRKKDEGNKLYVAGKYDQAIVEYGECLAYLSITWDLSTTEAETIRQLKISSLNNMAICNSKLGKHDQVIENCTAVLDLDKENVKALFRRATSYVAKQVHLPAKKDLITAIKLAPGNVELRNLYDQVQKALGSKSKA
eukprot:TRINITY_DN114_c0_g1_i1.p1 TRINITY_DN114_c0_g1~~TRINITY_DN114_c0_g1_i1.p1  ORF type:complete len:567 (-),score=99.46 TRINITY_DN114_c0_g1_i1:163-1791(-)